MKSIRQYLFAHIVCVSSVILVAGGVLLGLTLRHLDMIEFNEALEAKARTLATLVLREGRAIEIGFAGEFMPEFESTEHTEYFQFRLADGSLIERSDMLGERDLPFLLEIKGLPLFGNLRLPDGHHGRFVQIAFPPRTGAVEKCESRFQIPETEDPHLSLVVLTLARSREALDALLLNVYLTISATIIILVGFIALAVQKALRTGFRPLAHLNEQIACLRHDNLEQRIHLPDAPSEIAMLPRTVNSLLGDLQDAFIRERRFVSDVAHELRTPVAEFRAACEVGSKWSDDPDLVRRRFENLQQSAVNMERLLTGLLDLSRLDSGSVQAQTESVAVAALLDSCWMRVRAEEPEIGIRLENRIAPDLEIQTDVVKLEMIMSNLLSNATSYSVPGSLVTCTSETLADGRCDLLISNHVRDLVQADMQHIHERFWRKDAARTGGRHAGLGMSIVKSQADVLGIRIATSLSPDRIFTARLDFPPTSLVRPK